MKVDVERFDYNLLQDFKFMKSIKIVMDVSSNIHRYFDNTFSWI